MFEITVNDNYFIVDFKTDATLELILSSFDSIEKIENFQHLNDIFNYGDHLVHINPDDMGELLQQIETRTPPGAQKKKSALVTSSGFLMAIGELWREYASRLPQEIRVFQSLSAAKAWIEE